MTNSNITSVSYADRKKNWRGMGFLLLVILVTALSIYSVIAWMSDETQLPLSEIVHEGSRRYVTDAEVEEAVYALGPLQSFMDQDLDKIQKAVSVIPWVNRVSVRKQWPDTLKINVTEHNAEAIWNGNALLNDAGVPFKANPNDIQNKRLISLFGPDRSELEMLNACKQLRAILRKTGLDIGKLILNERRSWRIVTTNDIRIELGSESKQERLQRFVKHFGEIKATGEAIDYVDLRYDTGIAVGWKQNSNNKVALNHE